MNEVQKAQELAWKVGISGKNMRGDIETNWDQLMDFAELIVRECAGVGYEASYSECALNVSNKILEHFGVQE
jgi:hypothetical protein